MIDVNRLNALIRRNIEHLCRHFFPDGRKVGTEWRMGDVTGKRGNSLGIALRGPRAGLWHDRDGSGGGTFPKLIMEHAHVTFPEAARAIGTALGVSVETQ